MRKQHDADLCERIRELEKRVEELEARPTYVPLTHWCSWGCPIHHPAYPTTITWDTSGTTWRPTPNTTITYAKGVSTDSTIYTVGDIS